jgi:hypothetical protein
VSVEQVTPPAEGSTAAQGLEAERQFFAIAPISCHSAILVQVERE